MEDQISSSVVVALASAEETEPSDLDIIVGKHANLEAIKEFAADTNRAWQVTFELPTHSVSVKSKGVVLVDGDVEEHWKRRAGNSCD